MITVTKELKASDRDVFNAWLDVNMLSRWMFGISVRDVWSGR
jgi:hypothetical protein